MDFERKYLMNQSKVVAPLKEPIWKSIVTTMFEVYKPIMFYGFILRPEDVCPSMDIIPITIADGIKDLFFFKKFCLDLAKKMQT